MRILVLLLSLCFSLGFSAPVQADPKPWPLTWKWSHWDPAWGVPQDFQPYYESNGKNPYPLMDADKNWTPKNWMTSPEVMEHHVRQFYAADIIRDRGTADGAPAITVGPNFYHLGLADQSRIIEFMDAAFSMTSAETPQTLFLYDWKTDEVIGVRTQKGLDLY
ncbi:MAG: hypothetical protein GC136_03005 [Alphaproteobacteria bacterium]|nr:hypothetical protein [Alphaproteobacteria bacterium]